MKARIVLGVALIVLGVAFLLYPRVPYSTTEELVNVGPLQVQSKERRFFTVPPILSGLVLAAGIVLVMLPRRK